MLLYFFLWGVGCDHIITTCSPIPLTIQQFSHHVFKEKQFVHPTSLYYPPPENYPGSASTRTLTTNNTMAAWVVMVLK